MKVYFISGLGADERVFAKMTLPEKFQVHHIKWPSLSAGETMYSYCLKIASLLDTSQPFAVIGLSFGGMIAVELTKTVTPAVTIILSSISNRHEMPFQYKVCRVLRLNRLVPKFFLNRIYPFTYWYFGVKNDSDKLLLRRIIKDTSPDFLKWAVTEILNWRNETRPQNLFHIHGSSDRLFPARLVKADKTILHGGHLMVYTEAAAVSQIVGERLQQAV